MAKKKRTGAMCPDSAFPQKIGRTRRHRRHSTLVKTKDSRREYSSSHARQRSHEWTSAPAGLVWVSQHCQDQQRPSSLHLLHFHTLLSHRITSPCHVVLRSLFRLLFYCQLGCLSHRLTEVCGLPPFTFNHANSGWTDSSPFRAFPISQNRSRPPSVPD